MSNNPFLLQLYFDVASVRQGPQGSWLGTNVLCAYRYPWAGLSPRSNIEQEMVTFLTAEMPLLETLGNSIARAQPIEILPQFEPLELTYGLNDPSGQLEKAKTEIRGSHSVVIASPRYGVMAIPSKEQICLVTIGHRRPGVGLYLAERYVEESLSAFLKTFARRTSHGAHSAFVFAWEGNQLAEAIASEVAQRGYATIPQVIFDAEGPLVLAALTRK